MSNRFANQTINGVFDEMKIQLVETNQQLQDALTVREQVFIEEQNFAPEVENDQYDFVAKHIVIYEHEQPIATGRVHVVENTAKLERISVLKPYRGQGIGKMVLEALEKVAQMDGLLKATLDAQTHAQSFYEKLGYYAVSDIFEEHGIPHLVMVKDFT